jgi:carbamoyltransferase
VDPERDSQRGTLLGPAFSDDDVAAFIAENGIRANRFGDVEALTDRVAEVLQEDAVVGWFQGRMEFGPRALGARSIIGDARSRQMQTTMNLKIKFRESFRPFAPSVLRERVAEWFEMDVDSPYMLLVAPVHPSRRLAVVADGATGLDKLKQIRSTIPAVTHVDSSARVQTVHREHNPVYHRLIEKFHEKTGCPVIVNTSFNVRGEPIVCTPADAYRCFCRTHMDYLVLGSYVIDKKEQDLPPVDDAWMKEFELD